jgi:hypothetical protein
MSVDTEYELFVDAALAFGGMDQHAGNSLGFQLLTSASGGWFPVKRRTNPETGDLKRRNKGVPAVLFKVTEAPPIV